LRRWRGGVGVLHDKQAVGIRAQRDGVLFERLQDAAAQFAEDRVLLVDADADADRIGDDATGDGVDAGNVGIGDCDLFEGRVIANGEGGGAQNPEDFVRVGGSVDRNGEGSHGEVAERLETVAIWELGMK